MDQCKMCYCELCLYYWICAGLHCISALRFFLSTKFKRKMPVLVRNKAIAKNKHYGIFLSNLYFGYLQSTITS